MMPFPKYFLNINLILGFSVPNICIDLDLDISISIDIDLDLYRFHGHYIKFISSVTVKSNATAFSALMMLSQLFYKKLVV